jgi:hypothetical protein
MNNREKCLAKLSIFDNEDLTIDLEPDDYGFDTLEEVKQVILNAFNGKTENGLDSIHSAREYINDLIGDGEEDDIFEFIMRKYDLEDHPETLRDAEEEYDEALKTLKIIAKCLEVDELKKMNQFIPPSEYISLKNIVKEKRLPEDMEREMIGFMGKTKIIGGKRRKSKNTKRTKKQRKIRNKTRRSYKRKYKSRSVR